MMVHAWSQFAANGAALERHRVAEITWSRQRWREAPIAEAQLGRFFKDEAGSVPYIRDLFNTALAPMQAEDILVFTNWDICVRSDCAMQIAAALQDMDACYSYRRDFDTPFHEPLPDSAIAQARLYCGTDLFAFRKNWWLVYQQIFPDMLLGREAWDAILRTMMDKSHPGQSVHVPDLIYHHKHPSNWENARNRWRIPSQLHCIKLAKQWCARHGVNPNSWGLR